MDGRRGAALTAAAVIAGTLLAAPATAAPAGPACRVKVLDLPAGVESVRVDAGNGRWLAGTGRDAEGSAHLVTWERGEPSVLDPPADLVDVTAVSRNGRVGGRVDGAGFVLGRRGAPHRVEGAERSEVAGVTRDGRVAGADFAGGYPSPARWAPGAYDQPVRLELPHGYAGVAVGMADDGTVAATTGGRSGQPLESYAFVGGARVELAPTVGGDYAAVQAVANGWAAGWEYAGGQRAVRWELPSGAATTSSAWRDLTITAVNDHGVIGGQGPDGSPVLVVGTDRVDLPLPAGVENGAVLAVRSNGSAAGWANGDATGLRPVVWRCS